MEPGFSIRSLSLVDRGWIWATAHVRGGSEKGWGWFLDGRRPRRRPTPSPTSSPAPSTWSPRATARPGRIVAYGGSAGGMLMGAVANLRPDLWGGIIAAVPFVDVLNTMSDASLPLTPPEWPEWGNPLEDAAAYDLHRRLQPLRQCDGAGPIRRSWPPAACPTRASPIGSRPSGSRGCASRTTGDAPILLKINLEAGHGGASGRFDFLKEIALDYAFAIWAIERGLGDGVIDPDGDAGRRWTPLRAIYGHHVLHGFGTFEETPPEAGGDGAGARRRSALGLPYLVAEVDGAVAGFAYAAPVPPARGLSLHGGGQRLYRAGPHRARASAGRCCREVIDALRGAGPSPDDAP